MKITSQQIWFILIAGLFALTGCSGALLGEETEPEAPQQRLSEIDWPTPPPTPTAITPTPFPKIDFASTPSSETSSETVRPTPTPTLTPAPPASTSNEDVVDALEAQAAILQQASQIVSERFPPVAVAFTTIDSATLRQGPSQSYGNNYTLERGELLGIVGRSSGGDWLYGFGTLQKRGWIALTSVRVTGDLEKAPILPPDPVQAILAELLPVGLPAVAIGNESDALSSAAPSSGASTNTTASRPGADPADLAAVTSATVNIDGLNVRQGPGAVYGRLGSVTKGDTLQILAINRSKDWVLVSGDDLEFGWVSLELLSLEGSPEALPVVLSALPDTIIPPGQIAPIRSIAEVGSRAGVASTGSATSGATATPAPETSSTTGFARLGSVATAGLNKAKVDVRRGPGLEFGLVDTRTADDETVSILAQDKTQSWALVQTIENGLGWAAVDDLALTGSLENAPEVITAWVDSDNLTIRNGPSIIQNPVGLVNRNDLVVVHGLNAGRSWALIQSITSAGQGWLPLRFLTINGAAADLPQAPVVALAEQESDQPFVPAPELAAAGPGKLVIQLASGGGIITINPDGSDLQFLTNGIDPALSPDGQTVAFTRWVGETGTLWTINTNGDNERPILGAVKQAKGPEWSPDGSQIVLNFQQGGRVEPKDVCKDLDSDSGGPPRTALDIRTVTDDDGGLKLCWRIPADPFWRLLLVDVNDGTYQDLDGGTYAFRPAWDPSQSWRIVSDGGRGLLAVDVNRDYRQEISDNPNDGSPIFSPDGRFIALSGGPRSGGGGHDIYRLNRDGSGRTRLTQTPLWVTTAPDSDGKLWNNVAPAWSPNGAEIAFLTDRTGRWEIWIMNADGSEQRPLFPDEINAQLDITYNFVDERVLSWR